MIELIHNGSNKVTEASKFRSFPWLVRDTWIKRCTSIVICVTPKKMFSYNFSPGRWCSSLILASTLSLTYKSEGTFLWTDQASRKTWTHLEVHNSCKYHPQNIILKRNINCGLHRMTPNYLFLLLILRGPGGRLLNTGNWRGSLRNRFFVTFFEVTRCLSFQHLFNILSS
jgi:hypothetical protein